MVAKMAVQTVVKSEMMSAALKAIPTAGWTDQWMVVLLVVQMAAKKDGKWAESLVDTKVDELVE